ncbi:MAG: hypothetical protein ACOC87_03265 [Candidatus Natronoplasma sp.]
MTRTSEEYLVKKVAKYLLTYLKDGTINKDYIEKNIKYEGLDSIQDLETIFKIHFVLTEKVVDFLEELPKRVRRIKTECEKRTITRKGEVRGKIDWKRTTTEQLTDKTIFVCQNPSKNYDVPENLVLKKLLSVIYQVLDNELTEAIEEDYEWLGELQGEEDLVNSLKNIYQRNVHVNRIKDPKEYQVSERDISKAQNSRKELYRESAKLLINYRRLMRGNYKEDDLKELLEETLIIPDETSTLFELYSIFQLLKKWEEDFELKKIDKNYDEVAIFEMNGVKKKVYHTETGDLTLYEGIDELDEEALDNWEENPLKRMGKSQIEFAKMKKNLLDTDPKSFYKGIPDILVVDYEGDDITEITVGEVKYTEKKDTFSTGLEELITYIYFIKDERGYHLENKEVKGILVIDGKDDYLKDDKLDDKNVVIDGPESFDIQIYDREDLAQVED